jgi:hypothetical protein
MKHRTLSIFVVSIAAISFLGGCTTVKKNVNDSTPPTVVIKVRDNKTGQYAQATTASLSPADGNLDIMCINSDPEGVSSIDLSFSIHSDSCTVDGSPAVESFTINNAPKTLHQDLQPDAQGNVLTSIPMLAQLNGPFGCTWFGPDNQPVKGYPYGGKLVATCVGKNWSSNSLNNSAASKLTISLQ